MGNEDKKERRKALVIAISDYDSKKLHGLDFCKNDGEELGKFLKSKLYEIPENRKLIGKVDWLSMRNAIVEFFRGPDTKSKDLLFFYFSGHGVPDSYGDHYLSTSEIDPDEPDITGFPFYEITNNISKCIAEKIIVVLDCCYSGAVSLGKGSKRDVVAKAHEAIVTVAQTAKEKNIRVAKNWFILASSLSNQSSYKMDNKPFSMFTWFLLEGLNGGNGKCVDKDGKVTPFNLAQYVQQKVGELPVKKRQNQVPLVKIESTDNEISLVQLKKPKAKKILRKHSDFVSLEAYKNYNRLVQNLRKINNSKEYLSYVKSIRFKSLGTMFTENKTIGFLLFHRAIIDQFKKLKLDKSMGVRAYSLNDFYKGGRFAVIGFPVQLLKPPKTLKDLTDFSANIQMWHNKAHLELSSVLNIQGLGIPGDDLFYAETWNLAFMINSLFERELLAYSQANGLIQSSPEGIISDIIYRDPRYVGYI